MSENWMQTASGRAFPLCAPSPTDVDFVVDVPDALARTARFGGHVPAGPYSVAQHCVLGVDAILDATGSLELARAFLLHEGHEAYIGDFASPVAKALADKAAQRAAGMAKHASDRGAWAGTLVLEAIRALKYDIDAATHAAAGMTWPLNADIARNVHTWDMRMLRTERDHLMARPPHRWVDAVETAEPARLKGRITVWPWPKAADEWRNRFRILFPDAAARAAA